MTLRRRIGILLALSLLVADMAQRQIYVGWARLPPERGDFSAPGPSVRAILVTGKTLDETERATGWRDVNAADQCLQQLHGSRLVTRILGEEVVVDCCWSGEFLRSFADKPPGDIVSSTDAAHEAPFPTSFIGPTSFGRAFFAALASGLSPKDAVTAVNRSRARWSWLYPASIGTQGMHLR